MSSSVAIGTRKPLAPRRFRSPTWWKLALLRDRVFHERTAVVAWLPWPLRAGGYLGADLDAATVAHGLQLAPRVVDAATDRLRFGDGRDVTGLHFVRGRFLFAISRHARDVARDVRN